MWAGQGQTLKLEEFGHLFWCPWHFVYQFWTIYNKMELREKLSNKNCPFLFSPFYWKLFKIGMPSAKDIRKDVLIFQVWGSAPAPPTLPVFRLVLYHTVKDFLLTYNHLNSLFVRSFHLTKWIKNTNSANLRSTINT